MTRFAEGTEVPVEKSRAEIEGLLARYGATEFGSIRRTDHAAIIFHCKGLLLQFVLPAPTVKDVGLRDGRGSVRAPESVARAIEAETRRRWRALKLVIKAKLEAVATGITTFEREFLAHVVMKDGRAFGDVAIPAIKRAADAGEMPIGIPFLGSGAP